ncbi:MAG: sugar transferase [Oscillospiraceae bacterium]|nr:sugar transferase [Oscillospiraceae bacterium]
MKKKKLDGMKRTIRVTEGFLEVLFLSVAYYIVWRLGYERSDGFPAYYGNGKYVLAGVYAILVIMLFNNFDGFKFGYLKAIESFASQLIALFIVNFITYLQLSLIANVMISPLPILMLMVVDAVIALVCAFLFTFVYHRLYPPKNMVMIYGSDNAVDLKFKMDTRSDKYRITKLISAEEGFDAICRQIGDYDAVIINDVTAGIRNDLLKYCYHNRIRTYVAPKMTDIILKGATDISLFDTPLLLVRGKGLTFSQRLVKRLMDIVLSLIALIITSPILLIVSIAIKIEDGGPIFFKQERVTLGGKVFKILKFRSMIPNAEMDGKAQPAVDNDPRITKVGKVIRATRFDELPQILNILKGDMSIVGPRPERVEHVRKYSKIIPEFDFRLSVKGGLTGYAQVYGKYNTTPYDKLRLDLMYIENYSVLLDIKLILMTIRIILKKESTEGFNERKALERKKAQLLKQLHEEQKEETAVGSK